MAVRCAILDDYQNVALKLADWSKVKDEIEIKVFHEHLGGADVAELLNHFENWRRLGHFINDETDPFVLDAGQIEKAVARNVCQ